MSGIIENTDVLLVDYNDPSIGSISTSAGGGCAGAESFNRVMDDENYVKVSKSNGNSFNSFAEADIVKGKIVPGTVKVYPVRGNDKPPTFGANTADEVKGDIIIFYEKYKTGSDTLDAGLASSMASAITKFYATGDTKEKCEKAMYQDFPTKIYQTKAFGKVLERWNNLRINAQNYKKNYNENYTPDIRMICKPYFTFYPQKQKFTITITDSGGKETTYCKSALITLNKKYDFGYILPSIVVAGDLDSNGYSDWGGILGQYQTQVRDRLYKDLVNAQKTNYGGLMTYRPGGSSGPTVGFRLSTSKTTLFGMQVTIPIGTDYGGNWFFCPPQFNIYVSPDAIYTAYNLMQLQAQAQRDAANAAANAARAAIVVANPGVTTPPTPLQLDPTAPVSGNPSNPVSPGITDPVPNGIGDGQFGGSDGAFSFEL
jgi:hypothetical protein